MKSLASARSAWRAIQWWGEDKCFYRSEHNMTKAELNACRWAMRYLRKHGRVK